MGHRFPDRCIDGSKEALVSADHLQFFDSRESLRVDIDKPERSRRTPERKHFGDPIEAPIEEA